MGRVARVGLRWAGEVEVVADGFSICSNRARRSPEEGEEEGKEPNMRVAA